jgi:O-antigen ligase
VPSAAKSAVAPLYLLACLVLGGSAQGIWQNALLQIAGLALIVWAALARSDERLPRHAKLPLLIAVAAIAYAALQALPLPASLWEHGPRARIADDYRLLGQPVPALPLSLAPYESLSTLLCMIPPLAIFCAVAGLRAYRASWLAAALLCGAIMGVMLGALQVVAPGPNSPWYLYRETNYGLGVGFFANANHMATLLVISLPFAAALAAAGRGRNVQRYSALLVVLAGTALVLVVGLALNRSLAGYALGMPVLACSALLLLPGAVRLRKWLALAAALSMLAAVGALASSAIGSTKVGQDSSSSVFSREQILKTTGRAIADTMPFGSGLGSFVRVYRLYESPDEVTSEYVIHAHNDYAEIVLELGVAGVLLIVAFLFWWGQAVWRVWRDQETGPFARAASIASAAVLIHSLVDFPLRTAAISACFAMCLALLVERRVPQQREASELRPTRHIVIR